MTQYFASSLLCQHTSLIVSALIASNALVIGCQSSALRYDQVPVQYRSAKSTQNTQAIDFARATAPGASEAIIASEDLLKVTITTGRRDEKIIPIQTRVARDGTANLPLIGNVPVAGLESFAAGQNIAQLAMQRGIYQQPHVTVEIEAKAVNRITVLGAVEEPGVHDIPRGNSDLMSALAASGGLTEEAGTVVEIVRQPRLQQLAENNRETTLPLAEKAENEVQLASYSPQLAAHKRAAWLPSQTFRYDLSGSQPLQNASFQLNDRDIVRVIPRKKEMISVDGLVTNPGQFEIPNDQQLHVLDAIALAGGKKSPVADKVLVIRRPNESSEPISIQVSLARAKQDGEENFALMAGDTVTVEQTPATATVDTFIKFFRLSFGVASNTVF